MAVHTNGLGSLLLAWRYASIAAIRSGCLWALQAVGCDPGRISLRGAGLSEDLRCRRVSCGQDVGGDEVVFMLEQADGSEAQAPDE